MRAFFSRDRLFQNVERCRFHITSIYLAQLFNISYQREKKFVRYGRAVQLLGLIIEIHAEISFTRYWASRRYCQTFFSCQ
jgi:hypothetical protein